MPWILLAVAMAALYGAFVAHSALLMLLGFVVGLGALGGWVWLRYRTLFPAVGPVLDETPLSADDVRLMRERMTNPPPAVAPAATAPDLDALRAAGQRVAERDVERARVAKLEQELDAMRQRIAEIEAAPTAAPATPVPVPSSPVVAAPPPPAAPAVPVATPAPRPAVPPRAPDEAWNPYALAPPKPAKVLPAPVPGMHVPVVTPLRDDEPGVNTPEHGTP